jgi:Glycosyltransferase family 87
MRLSLAFLMALVGLFLAFNPKTFQTFAGLGDLYPRWYGSKAAFQGRNPYSNEVTNEIQIAYYGHVLGPEEKEDHQRFAYPAYVIFLLWPIVGMDFHSVRLLIGLVLLAAVAAIPLLWLKILGWNIPRKSQLVVSCLLLGLISSVQAIRLEQLAILVALLVSVAVFFIRENRLLSAGLVLALATIKPQMLVLPLLWLAVWIQGDWKARWKLAAGFLGSLALLSFAGELVVPGWIPQFLEGLRAYSGYTEARPLLLLLLGSLVGTVAIGAALYLFLAKASCVRELSAGTSEFVSFTALSFCLGSLVTPALIGSYNQLLLVPAALLSLERLKLRSEGLARGFLAMFFVPTVIALASHMQKMPKAAINASVLILEFALPLVIAAAMASIVAPLGRSSPGGLAPDRSSARKNTPAIK